LEGLLGAYISVPFCKAKCSYCNFASGVLGAGTAGADRIDRYVEQVCAEIGSARARAAAMRAELPERLDTVYFGGGTPSLLSAEQMPRVFAALRGEFEVTPDAEITLECAPGQLGDETLDELLRLGMNRVSFGVQSFVDAEARAVGRMHTRAICLAEIERMRAAGVQEINVDLIVGLTRQTAVSWCESVEVALGSGVPHVSVYMLEVDEDSRLGRELLKAGNREQRTGNREQGAGNRLKFGASDVPGDDAIAEWYAAACEGLEAGGVMQYEISNFARKSHASRHNVKYWRREPYVGFGLDAHSMLRACPHGPKAGEGAVRWANTDELSRYEGLRFEVQGSRFEGPEVEWIGMEKGFEEAMFLGLRMNVGVDLEELRAEFGEGLTRGAVAALTDVEQAGLVEREGSRVRLTARGRMVSNEVFSRLLVEAVV